MPVTNLIPLTGWQRVYLDSQFQIYLRPALSLPVEENSSASFQGSFP
jgi:hypothetical protein